MLILKIGGGRNINLEGVADDLTAHTGPVVIVHGANAWRDTLAERLGIHLETVTSVRGYDSVFSDDAALDLLMMAYAGLRNKRVVEALQRRNIPAVGLTGLDGRTVVRPGAFRCGTRHGVSGKVHCWRLPMGAVLCSDRISVPSGSHGTTFGGNPLCCAAALATLNYILSEDLPHKAAEKGRYVGEQLTRLKSSRIREIRRLGLMVGIDLREKVKPYLQKLQDAGVLALPAGPTVLRLLPPLTIDISELDQVVESIRGILPA